MVLNPRLPVNEDPLHDHDAASGATAGGSIVKLQADGTIAKITTSGQVPYGILFNNVKSPIPGLPQNFLFPGELGSVDAFLGDPVLVYIGAGGLFETTHYKYSGSAGIDAGTKLYCLTDAAVSDDNSKLVNTPTPVSGSVVQEGGSAKVIAVATQPLTDEEASAQKPLAIKMLL
jgi:hypothetical protein